MKGIRVGLALSGWGSVFGMVAATLLVGFPLLVSSEFGAWLLAVFIGGLVGAVLGGVLGCPVALLSALMADREPRTAARLAVLTYFVTAGVVVLAGFLHESRGIEGYAQFAILPIVITLPFAAARVHRTVRLEVAHEGFWR